MNVSAKKLIAWLSVSVFMLVSFTAEAAGFADLKIKLNRARDTLTVMIRDKDNRGPEQQKLVKDSAEAVSEALAKIKVPESRQARLNTLVSAWNAFKKTREEELVPLLLEGKQEQAVKLASGIQAERFSKMMELCDELAY